MNLHIRKHLAFGSVITHIVFDNEKKDINSIFQSNEVIFRKEKHL